MTWRRIGHPIGRAKCSWRDLDFLACLTAMIAVWLCLGGTISNAQNNGTGALTGTVTDSQRAVIVNAQVKVANVATGVTETSTTNGTGYFEFDSLTPGTYTISVMSPGFGNLLREGMTLEAGATLNVPLMLKLGATSATITVTADASLLNTESAQSGQVLTARQVSELPVTGSNPAWFIDMAPGVSTPFSQTASTSGTLNWNGVSVFSTFGQQQRSEYSLDGAPNMGNGRSNGINPSPDEIAEMKVDVTGFDAAEGKTIGATVTQVTRSGSNQYHGTVRESYQNNRWSALDHFEGLNYKYQEQQSGCDGSHSSPACLALAYQSGWAGTHENNGGASFGGPITIPHVINGKDKLFFFVSILDDVYSQGGSASTFIPTVQERGGDFSDLPQQASGIPAAFTQACGSGTPYFGQYQIYNPYSVTLDSNGIPRRAPICGNIIPSGLLLNSTMSKFYNSLLPTPTQNNPTGTNFQYGQRIPQTYRSFTGRFDYAISEKNHAFFRYTRADYTNTNDGFTVGDVDQHVGPNWIDVAALNLSHIFSDRTNLDVNIGGINFEDGCCYYPNYEKYFPSTVGLPSYLDQYAANLHSLPIMQVGPYAQIGQNNSKVQTFRNLAFRADLTQVRGKHTIRLGGEYRIQNNAEGYQGNAFGTYKFDDTYTQENNGSDSSYSQSNTGLSYAALLMGVQTQSSVSIQAPFSISTPYYALYIGDTWRVNSKLTLIPGIRFEFEHGPTEKHNYQIVGWDPTAALPIAGPANTAYAAARASASAEQQAVLPPSLVIQGGPLFSGVNGAPTTAWNNSYRFLPRLAFSYQLRSDTVIRGGYGLFFDTLNALNTNLDQDGFSAGTSVPSSTTYGTDFALGAPPISNPFPIGANGQRFVAPVGNSAGSLFYAGQGPGNITDHNLSPGRQERGYFGIQHQFGAATMVELAWVGGLTTNLEMGQPYKVTPASFFAAGQQPNTTPNALLSSKIANPFLISNFSGIQSTNPAAYNLMSLNSFFTQPQIPIGNLVSAYPQMSGLSINRAIGETKFQELQASVTRRYSLGLTAMGELQINKDQDRDYYANGFDTTPSWEPSNTTVPVRVTAEGIYDLPFGRGRAWATSGISSALLGGFQLGATYEGQTGQFVGFNNLFYIGSFKASQVKIKHPIYVDGQATGGSNYVQWLNPGNASASATTVTAADGQVTTYCTYGGTGFVTNPQCQPTAYNLRTFPTRVPGIRQMGWNNANANLQRTFRLVKEKLSLQARFEVYNVFNHQVLGGVDSNPTDPNFGRVTGDGFPAPNARWIDIQGYLKF